MFFSEPLMEQQGNRLQSGEQPVDELVEPSSMACSAQTLAQPWIGVVYGLGGRADSPLRVLGP